MAHHVVVAQLRREPEWRQPMQIERGQPANGALGRRVGTQAPCEVYSAGHPIVEFAMAVRDRGVDGEEPGEGARVGAVVEPDQPGGEIGVDSLPELKRGGKSEWRASVVSHRIVQEEHPACLRREERACFVLAEGLGCELDQLGEQPPAPIHREDVQGALSGEEWDAQGAVLLMHLPK